MEQGYPTLHTDMSLPAAFSRTARRPHRGRGESGAQQNTVPATRIDQNKFSAAEGKFNEQVFRVNRNQRLVSKRAGDQRVTLFRMPDMQPPF